MRVRSELRAGKLDRIPAFADFSACFETGAPVAGAEHMRLPP